MQQQQNKNSIDKLFSEIIIQKSQDFYRILWWNNEAFLYKNTHFIKKLEDYPELFAFMNNI